MFPSKQESHEAEKSMNNRVVIDDDSKTYCRINGGNPG